MSQVAQYFVAFGLSKLKFLSIQVKEEKKKKQAHKNIESNNFFLRNLIETSYISWAHMQL